MNLVESQPAELCVTETLSKTGQSFLLNFCKDEAHNSVKEFDIDPESV